MTDIIPIRLKGVALCLGGGFRFRVFYSCSAGLIFAKPLAGRALVFSLLVIYARQDQCEVRLTSSQHPETACTFRKIFVRKRFPYISFRPGFSGAYKAFFPCLKLLKGTDEYKITLEYGEKDEGPRETALLCDIRMSGRKTGRKTGQNKPRPQATPAGRDMSDAEIRALADIPYDQALEKVRHILQADAKGDDAAAQALRMKIYAGLRVNHHHIFTKLRENAQGDAAGQPGGTALAQSLDRIVAPDIIGPHGFTRSLATIGDDELRDALQEMFAFIRSIGATGFLNNGTLLGARRSGDLLPTDDDLDIGIHVNGKTEAEVIDEWRRVKNAIGEKYQIIGKGDFFAIDIPGLFEVDVFAAWTIGGRAYVYPYCAGDVAQEDLLPVSQITLRGTSYPAPHNVEALLVADYGENWQVPDPYWKFDWEANRRRFGQMKKHFYEIIGS